MQVSGFNKYTNSIGCIPSICEDSTERSSSPCIKPIVRRNASVTSSLAFIRISSLRSRFGDKIWSKIWLATNVTFSFPSRFSVKAADAKSSSRCDLL